jgi:hypothetical protein
MQRAIVVLLLIVFASCNNDLKHYEKIIETTDRIEVHYKNDKDTIILTPQQTNDFKNIFTTDVIPKIQQKFLYDIAVDLYKDSSRIGFIMLSNNSVLPFANFSSDSLDFGFVLTYRMGMFFDNIKSK